MSLLRALSKIGIALAIAGASFAAHAVVIDFDALDSSSGQPQPLLIFSEDGFTFDVSTVGNTDTDIDSAAIFNSNCQALPAVPCNGDEDITPAMQGDNGISGNVLIIQEPDSPVPDDDRGMGGDITLTVAATPDDQAFRFVGASAIDNATFTFYADQSGDGIDLLLLGMITIGPEGDVAGGTASTTFAIDSGFLQVGDAIVIDFSGSGAVDSLVLAPVPIPAALPLLLSALAGLGLTARFRRKQVS